ncbi:MAG: hypothetical protein ACO1NV_13455 [Leptospira bouyouniensis]|uniref:Lipoprotein n=1 Tax=Leptospira bouyouniensis TaxID=2484911 RepID=A0ABY2L970_9LEPT|nr:hypothetical protein [Leptospira bouyouniensis]TGK52790.1 hypothetical protein EHQ10_03300 [Leptospira bouyouniensis]TGM87011.1 hypothetical protein EHQ99_00475 [Leptospira bouyouniensis]
MKTLLKLTIVMLSVFIFIECADNGKVDKSVADNNLVLGLIKTTEASAKEAGQIEIRGTFFQASCSAGTCNTPGSNTVSIQSNFGTTTGYLYVDYVNGSGTSTYRVNAEIVEFSNAERVLYYKPKNSANISALIWTITSENEILICDVFNGKPTLAETKADLSSRKASGTVYTTNPKAAGCNGSFAFNFLTRTF